MGIYRVDVSKTAEEDLRDIVRYISSALEVPKAALNMMNLIEKAIAGLSDYPQRYSLITDDKLAIMGYRKLIVKNYIVFFTIDEKHKIVDIERILYARRDWHNIL